MNIISIYGLVFRVPTPQWYGCPWEGGWNAAPYIAVVIQVRKKVHESHVEHGASNTWACTLSSLVPCDDLGPTWAM